MLENLITDRTLSDFQRWQQLREKGLAGMTETELAEWLGGMKGSYNASDLNRVGEALNYLRNRLTAAGYLLGNEFNMPVTWNDTHVPTAATFTAYISAVEVVRSAMSQYSTTPQTPPDVGGLDYQGANDIEKILLDIEDLINKMLTARYYCGDLYSGEI